MRNYGTKGRRDRSKGAMHVIRKPLGLALAGTLIAISGLVASPAYASVTGEVVFQCDANMTFPGGGAECNGLASEVAATGTDSLGRNYVIAGAGRIHMRILEHSVVCVGNTPPPLWAGGGEASVTGLTAIVNGVTTTAHLEMTFTVTVVGTAMVYQVQTATFTFGGATATATGVGTGQFVPILSAGNVCPNGGPMRAAITGEIALTG